MRHSTEQITLYEIMGEPHDVHLDRNHDNTFDLRVDNLDFNDPLFEKGMHSYAIEGMAIFCNKFLNAYREAVDN